MTVIERQIADLNRVAGEVSGRPLPTGATLIKVAQVDLPPGWNKRTTSIQFLAPVGYPFATPDCFWADSDLRLANGNPPTGSNLQAIVDTGEQGLWFSWHVQSWNPNRDTLMTFFKVIEQRLAAPK